MNGVYLLHFDPAYRHARHYLGWAADIERRVGEHRKGMGARLTQVVVESGAELVLARVWTGEGRGFERTLKNQKHAPRLCPICRGMTSQQPNGR